MMSLKEISKQKTLALEAEHERALSDTKGPLAAAAEFTRHEQPKIKTRLGGFDLWRKEKIDSINWKAFGGMPKTIADLLSRVEGFKNNLAKLADSLKRFDQLRWQDCWGNRADGARDINVAANVRGGFDFNCARGVVAAIDDIQTRLEYEREKFEAEQKWKASITGGQAASINIPTEEYADQVRGVHNLNH